MVAASISNFAALHSLKKCGLPTASGAALKIHLGSVTVSSAIQHVGTFGSLSSVPQPVCRRHEAHTPRLCDLGEWIYLYIICYFIFINWRSCTILGFGDVLSIDSLEVSPWSRRVPVRALSFVVFNCFIWMLFFLGMEEFFIVWT